MKKFVKLSDVKNNYEMQKEEMKKTKAGNEIPSIPIHVPMYSAQIVVVLPVEVPGTVVVEYPVDPIAGDQKERSNS